MATYRLTSPDGQTYDVTAPDGASEDAVLNYAKAMFKRTPEKPKVAAWNPSSPTEGMSGLDTVAAGMGKRMTDWGRAAGQMLGVADQSAVDEARKLDAPLMDTFGGKAGAVGADLLSAVIPGTNTVKGAAIVSGALGALTPTEEGGWEGFKSRMKNIGVDAALGGGSTWALKGATEALKARLAAKEAGAAQAMTANAARDAAIAEGKAAGYVAPPSISGGGAVSKALEGLSGKQKTNQASAIKNQPVTERLARSAVGLDENAALSPEVLQGIRSEAYKAGYEPVSAIGVVNTDAAYKAALDKISEKYVGAAKDFPGAASDSVRGFIDGASKKTIPARTEWVDDAGQVVSGFVEPKAPKMRNLLDEIKQAGGISTGEVGELNTASLHKNYPGLLRKNGGMSADGVLEWMKSNGWISEATARAAEDMPGGAQEVAKDMLRSAIAREQVIHPRQYEAWAMYSQDAKDALAAGMKKQTIPAQEIGGLRVQSFDAGNGLKMSQILRDEASAAFRAGDPALSKAKREAAKAIEDQIERHLASMGDGAGAKDALANFRKARELMAKTHSVEKALVAGTNQVDARELARQLAKGKPLSGDLATIAKFSQATKGSGLTSSITGIPEAGHSVSFSPLDFFTAGIGTQAPAMLALPVGRAAARAAILSGPAQGAIKPSYGPGMLARRGPQVLSEAERWRLGLLAPALYGSQQ